MQAPAAEVPPARPTKILSMMQQLPTGMARKYWSLGDYSILRKMYTGYASTVYQVRAKRRGVGGSDRSCQRCSTGVPWPTRPQAMQSLCKPT